MRAAAGGRALSRRCSYLIPAAVAVLAIAFALVLAGCGQKEADVSSSIPPPPTRGQNVAATGPAISDKLAFDQLALDSAVKRVPSPTGPIYLQFMYTDVDGKVYKCKLPEAMAKGQYKHDEWIRTFNVYRLPEVIKQKRIAKQQTHEVTDFPFISPKPVSESAPQGGSSEAPSPLLGPAPAPPAPARPAPSAGPARISSGPLEDMAPRGSGGRTGGRQPQARDFD
jgi:hypothetical protein